MIAVAVASPVILAVIGPPGHQLLGEVSGEPARAQRRRRVLLEAVVLALALLACRRARQRRARGRPGSDRGPRHPLSSCSSSCSSAPVGRRHRPAAVPFLLRASPQPAASPRGLTGFLGAAHAARAKGGRGRPGAGAADRSLLGDDVGASARLDPARDRLRRPRGAVGADLQIARRIRPPTRSPGSPAHPRRRRCRADRIAFTRINPRALRGDHVTATGAFARRPRPDLHCRTPTHPLVPAGADLDALAGSTPIVLAALTSPASVTLTKVTIDGQGRRRRRGVPDVRAAGCHRRVGGRLHVASRRAPRRAPDQRNAFVRFAPGADTAAISAAVRDVVEAKPPRSSSAASMTDELSDRNGTARSASPLLATPRPPRRCSERSPSCCRSCSRPRARPAVRSALRARSSGIGGSRDWRGGALAAAGGIRRRTRRGTRRPCPPARDRRLSAPSSTPTPRTTSIRFPRRRDPRTPRPHRRLLPLRAPRALPAAGDRRAAAELEEAMTP